MTNLVSNKKSRKRKRKKHIEDKFDELVVPELLQCDDAETADYVKAVVKALQLGNGEVLLAVAWVTAEGRQYHKRFPRVLGIDVKYGTNNERRPLCRFVGKTGNNRNYSVMNCYMPSEQRYAYSWAIGQALASNLDKPSLARTELLITDEDQQQMDAISSTIQMPESVFGKRAKKRGCKWHKVSKCAF